MYRVPVSVSAAMGRRGAGANEAAIRARARRTSIAVSALLVLVVLGLFGRVAGHEFLTYDDNEYVTGNAEVRAGLTAHGVVWAFTTAHAHNWHPLTWVSHMMDVQLFGLHPAGHHVTSLLLHAANTVLLFLLLRRLTRATWRSALVAALFGVHPLHVESVAWIAERKDVLSTFFMLIALWLYCGWAERGGLARYVAVLAAFALGLLSKPMLVTLPLLLLVIDVWPLGRRNPLGARLLEKTPFLVLSLASSVVTLWAQRQEGAMKSLEAFPLSVRAANALVSYVRYLGQAVWPSGLAAFYPHPGGMLPTWQVALAGSLLVAITALAFALRTTRPYLAFGWSWYLVTLLPVIGLIQVGDQAMADRYTYVPLIGPFVAVVWGMSDAVDRWRPLAGSPYRSPILGAVAGVTVAALGVCAWIQVGYWHDTVALFEHAVGVTSDNYRAHQVLGDGFAVRGDLGRAETHYKEALRIRPDDRIVSANLGSLSLQQGRYDEAVDFLRDALRIDAGNASAHDNLGIALNALGRFGEAEAEFRRALSLRPRDAGTHYNFGITLAKQGKSREAVDQFRQAIECSPELTDAYRALAGVLLKLGDDAGARDAIRAGRDHGFRPTRDLLDRLAATAP